jgi:hypothetical protein
MKISIKRFDVAMEPNNNGVEFEVRDGDRFLGDFIVDKTGIVWCSGKTTKKCGIRKDWNELIELIQNK